jgi:hypothetical protein
MIGIFPAATNEQGKRLSDSGDDGRKNQHARDGMKAPQTAVLAHCER